MVNTLRDVLARADAEMRKAFADPNYESKRLERERALEEEAKRQREYRRRDQGIPVLFRPWIDDPWASLVAAGHTKPEDRAALDFAKAWREQREKPVVVMAGELGRGKSVALCWLVDQVGGVYVEASDICRSGWYGDDYWDKWLGTGGVLALDELGMEPMDPKGWWESKLHRLLSGRLLQGRRIAIATNLNRVALRQRYGSDAMARTWDRLQAGWMAKVFTGPSMRNAPNGG